MTRDDLMKAVDDLVAIGRLALAIHVDAKGCLERNEMDNYRTRYKSAQEAEAIYVKAREDFEESIAGMFTLEATR